MRIRWRGLELPTRVVRDDAISTDTFGRFSIEPFERGFGTTVGNSLRRILLSSLEGSAVTHVRIAGADHEFCSLEGVYEDVSDIILNVKQLVVSLDSDVPKTMRVERSAAGDVRAADLVCDPAITVHNPDLVLATLTAPVKFAAEFTVTRGRGYVSAAENVTEEQEVGVIAVDSIFSPVTRVRYRTEDTRVGQKTNYDRLVLEIWAKGPVRPEDALVESAKILRKHLNPFVHYYELGHMLATGDSTPGPVVPTPTDDELRRKLALSIATLDLSVRAANCLEAAHIVTIGDLVRLTEPDLLELRAFGKTSLIEVKRKLAEMGLSLGMQTEVAAGAQA